MTQQFSEAYPRFTAKVKDTTTRVKVYSVYDRGHASYPTLVPGFGAVKQSGTEEEMLAEAQRLNDFVAAGGTW